MMNNKTILVLLMVVFSVFSCKHPEDEIILAVDHTNSILRQYEWHLQQFTIDVRNEEIPPPLLFNSTDSLVRAGRYDLRDMVFEEEEMQTYRVNFTEEGKVSTSGGQLDLLAEKETKYFVYNDRSVRISSEEKLNYNYYYDREDRTMSLQLNEERAGRLIRKINDKLVDRVANRTPNKLGDAVANLLFNNKALQRMINNVVVDALSGKLAFINEIDPDEASQVLAEEIINALSQINWEQKLTELITSQLEGISNLDIEVVAEAIATEVAQLINDQITVDRLNTLIFPYIEYISINAEKASEDIATLIVNVFFEVFDEQFLQSAIANAWTSFTQLDEEKIGAIADTLAYVVETIWLNHDNIAAVVLPFTQQIENTSLLQLGNLAAETTESIKNLVDIINDEFPDLNLSPNYDNLENAIRLFYIGIKPVITIIGSEQAASDLADLILGEFLNRSNLKGAFVAALQFLQSIDPETAGTTIAGWLVNMEEEISAVLINYIRNFLSPILDNLNPESTALAISEALNDFIEENVSPESVKSLILPLLENFKELNAEEVANYIALRILELDIIQDNITQETIQTALIPVLTSVKESNVDQLSQNLINAVVNSGIFEDVITENRVSTIISLLMYKAAWDNVLIANNFEKATILLKHE